MARRNLTMYVSVTMHGDGVCIMIDGHGVG